MRTIWAATDRLKDEIAASLTRGEVGERALLIPRNAPPDLFAEYTAERRDQSGRWDKRPGVKRNESLDLSVYALALVIVLGAEKINPDRPPAWAIEGPGNAFAVGGDAAPEAEAPPEPTPEAPAARDPKRNRRPIRPRPDFSGW